jgi:hypothetical protein
MTNFYKLPADIAQRKDLTGNEKIVYSIITGRIRENGKSWPGLRLIAKDAGITKPTVIEAISKLRAAGLIEVENRGNGRCNHYMISQKSGQEPLPVKDFDRSNIFTTGGQETLPEAVKKLYCNRKNHLIESLTRGDDDGFSHFWKAYPRRVGKGAARKIWQKIKPDEDLLCRMIAAVERQKLSAQWQKDGGQYIPHPSTWLNHERWEDEYQTEADPTDTPTFTPRNPTPEELRIAHGETP